MPFTVNLRTQDGVVTKGDLRQPKLKIEVTKSNEIKNILAWMLYLKVKGGPQRGISLKLSVIRPVSRREVPNQVI